MLTIENINKIVGERVVNEWYIKSMHGTTIVKNLKGTHANTYRIVIQNEISRSIGKIYLDREYANGNIKNWYELYCERGGKRYVQLLSKRTIADVKELIEQIKMVALD
jgi:hypothetical protein